MIVMVMVMIVVTMRSRTDADINAGTVMVVMVMMPDHNLRSLCAARLRQTLIVGFQQRQGVRDRIEKVAIARGFREFRPAGRRRLGSSHGGEGCGRTQQASKFLVHTSSKGEFRPHSTPDATSHGAEVSSQARGMRLEQTSCKAWRLTALRVGQRPIYSRTRCNIRRWIAARPLNIGPCFG